MLLFTAGIESHYLGLKGLKCCPRYRATPSITGVFVRPPGANKSNYNCQSIASRKGVPGGVFCSFAAHFSNLQLQTGEKVVLHFRKCYRMLLVNRNT